MDLSGFFRKAKIFPKGTKRFGKDVMASFMKKGHFKKMSSSSRYLKLSRNNYFHAFEKMVSVHKYPKSSKN